ncbi:hypothetical protein [Thermogemmatispora carboxidivorans]|uniref:hypothetical protein n=1 Tax=Thermogemmatispora carboxidivorans TaxID=1382306 RepID=UPI00069CBCC3|nr:hypothetical protein [Thermogemmatispora carboxidivorans]
MLPDELRQALLIHGVSACDEVALRQALETYVPTYTLIRLAPWPARRWKCHYRLLMRDQIYDAQSVAEAYARGLLAVLEGRYQPEPETQQPLTAQDE